MCFGPFVPQKTEEEKNLEADKILNLTMQAADPAKRDAVLQSLNASGPVAHLGSFASLQLPRIGVGALKTRATASPYDGLRIKTPGKV